MTNEQRTEEIRGKTFRLKWTEGPTKGQTHELVFREDGNVTWDAADSAPKGDSSNEKERAEYAALKVADQVCLVSFMGSSGYTLTVVLNFSNNSIVGFASGAKEWYPVKGKFEIVSGARA